MIPKNEKFIWERKDERARLRKRQKQRIKNNRRWEEHMQSILEKKLGKIRAGTSEGERVDELK